MNTLIVFASKQGQTEKIAERIAQTLRSKHIKAHTQSVEQLPAAFDIASYDAVIIGGPIHMGKYPKSLKKFVLTYRDWLNNHSSALFTVCMAIRSQKAGSRQQAAGFGEQFSRDTLWQPAVKDTFAGAVKYTQYGFLTRFIMKQISKHEGGSTDTTRDHEYTDWDAVDRFTDQFREIVSAPHQS